MPKTIRTRLTKLAAGGAAAAFATVATIGATGGVAHADNSTCVNSPSVVNAQNAIDAWTQRLELDVLTYGPFSDAAGYDGAMVAFFIRIQNAAYNACTFQTP